MIQYTDTDFKEMNIEDIEQCASLSSRVTTRIDFVGLDQTQDIQAIGKMFSLHPLTLEDIANIQQRPKIEDMDDYIFLTLKMFDYHPDIQQLEEEQISFVLGKHYLISFQEKDEHDDFALIKERIKTST